MRFVVRIFYSLGSYLDVVIEVIVECGLDINFVCDFGLVCGYFLGMWWKIMKNG